MERMSIDEIKAVADPVAACKEQLRPGGSPTLVTAALAVVAGTTKKILQHWRTCCTS